MFGGLIPNNVRSTIDSILHSCLTKLYSNGGSSIFAYVEAKRSILQLATTCVAVPWGDGGRSATNEIVRKVSLMLKNDPDVAVASMALSTLCVIGAFMTPRAPAILLATRGQDYKNDLTASDMLKSINEKEKEIEASSRTKEKKSSKPAAIKSAATTNVDTSVDSSAVKSKKSKITETAKTVKKEPVSSNNGVDVVKNNMAIEYDAKKISSEKAWTDADVVMNDVGTSEVTKVDENLKDNEKAEASANNVELPSQQEKQHKDKDDTDADDDDFSLDDFPEIVDEEPDEGDR